MTALLNVPDEPGEVMPDEHGGIAAVGVAGEHTGIAAGPATPRPAMPARTQG